MFSREKNIVVAKFTDGDTIQNLKNLMKELGASSALILNGIGQIEHAIIGYFDGNDYIKKRIEEPAELVSLQGNIGIGEGDYIVHAHASLALKNHAIVGGHLIGGNVKVVNEIALYVLDEIKIERKKHGKLMEMFIS